MKRRRNEITVKLLPSEINAVLRALKNDITFIEQIDDLSMSKPGLLSAAQSAMKHVQLATLKPVEISQN